MRDHLVAAEAHLSAAERALDRAVGSLPELEADAARQLRSEVLHALRRARNLLAFARTIRSDGQLQ